MTYSDTCNILECKALLNTGNMRNLLTHTHTHTHPQYVRQR